MARFNRRLRRHLALVEQTVSSRLHALNAILLITPAMNQARRLNYLRRGRRRRRSAFCNATGSYYPDENRFSKAIFSPILALLRAESRADAVTASEVHERMVGMGRFSPQRRS